MRHPNTFLFVRTPKASVDLSSSTSIAIYDKIYRVAHGVPIVSYTNAAVYISVSALMAVDKLKVPLYQRPKKTYVILYEDNKFK
jgi:hypothetical protein